MKKLIGLFSIIAFLLVTGANEVNAQAGGITNGSKYMAWEFNDSLSSSSSILFPSWRLVTESDYAASYDLDAEDFYTYVRLDTLTGNTTINVDAASHLTAGAQLWIEFRGDTARIVTFGTGIDAKAWTTDTLKREVAAFIFDGTTFYPSGSPYRVE